MSLAWTAYRLVAPALGALAPAAGLFTSPLERELWGERMGDVHIAGGCDAWVHAASLGEAGAAGPLVAALLDLDPAARLCLTATTRTGRERLKRLGPPVSLAPIDSPQAVARFFAGTRPRRLFIVETELWPHWLMHARAARVPVAIVSARLSPSSVRGYLGLGSDLRGLVAGLAAVLCQTDEDRSRWLEIGARPLVTSTVGNLKWDGLPVQTSQPGAARRRLGLDPERPLLVLGSLRPGEARMLAMAWITLPAPVRQRWQVVAVPRHLRASRDLEEEARRVGVSVVRDALPAGGEWRWEDRTGVLNDYYAAAEVAVVGGSLTHHRGHNPLEPAACGAAVVTGPHHESQLDAVTALRRHDAIRVVEDQRDLQSALETLLSDDADRARRGSAARSAVRALGGAARRAAQCLLALDLWPVPK